MRLLLFNPDTDLALASGHVTYTPKKGVEQMRRDLFPLMAFFSRPGDRLLLPVDVAGKDAGGSGWLEELSVGFATEEETERLPLSGVVPWGWNMSLVSKLTALGVPREVLPGEDFLDLHRQLSSRTVLEQLSRQFEGINGLEARSWNLSSLNEVEHFLDEGVEYVFKIPYSSSGKGLLWPKVLGRELLLRRVAAALRQCGVVTAQKAYDKVLDLAMEFEIKDGRVSFEGYSLFKTNSRGLYEGNLCLSDKLAESYICKWIPVQTLHMARSILLEMLPGMGYEGVLGVDMMVARNAADECFLVPLLEMNLRHTMGMVAGQVYRRFLNPSSAAFLRVRRFPSHGQLEAFVMQKRSSSPLTRDSNGLVSGFLPLSQMDSSAQFLAGLEILPNATPDTPSLFL